MTDTPRETTVERKPWREEPESCSWRAEGRSLYAVQPGRAYYQSDHDMFLGVLDTSALAEAAASDHNALHGLGLPRRANSYGDTKWTGKSRSEP